MNHSVRLAALALAASALSSSHAAEGYAIWDNFDGATEINAARWLGTDRVRLIEAGVLRFVQRDLGSQSGDSGMFSSSWGSRLANPAKVTRLLAAVTVNAFDVTGCGANTAPSSVIAGLNGQFFNAGPGLPTSSINNVGAVVQFRRGSNSADPIGVLRVEGTVYQCTVADCNYGASVLGSVDLGTAVVGETLSLRVDWDSQANRFGFGRVNNQTFYVNYAVADSQAAFGAFRQIGTRTEMANCLSGNRTEGFIDAKFDAVSVNLSAAP
jgi:hypothetical protein